MARNLQERRHADTKVEVVSAALALFAQHGFGQVSMDDIARAAGVSRRTVYRRFPTKDHIVLEVPRRWLAVWDQAVDDAHGAAPVVVVESACLAVARYVDANRSEVLAAYAALDESPTLAARGATDEEWIDRVVRLLRREPTRLPGSTPQVIAGAYLGALDAMMNQWVRGGGRGSVRRETKDLVQRLRPIWPAP